MSTVRSGRKRSEPPEPKSDDLSSSDRAAYGWTVGQAGVQWAGGADDKLGLWHALKTGASP